MKERLRRWNKFFCVAALLLKGIDMEKIAEWFYQHMSPWSCDEHLILASIVGCVLMMLASIGVIVIAFRLARDRKASDRKKLYRILTCFCTPVFSLAFSLMFRWYISAGILTLLFAWIFFSAKGSEIRTRKNIAIFFLINIVSPNLLIILLSLLGLPYKVW